MSHRSTEAFAVWQADLDAAEAHLRSPRPSLVALGTIARHAVAVGEGIVGIVLAAQLLAF